MSNYNKKIKKNIQQFIKKYNNSRGWLLIVLVFYFFIVSTFALMGPLSTTAKQLSKTIFEENIRRSQQILLTTNSPIRNYLVNELYERIQNQLVEHLAKAGGSTNYMCQNVEVPPTSTGAFDSNLENQFGLCSPEKLFEAMDGNTKQTIDFNAAFGLKFDPNLSEEGKLRVNQIVAQNKNTYDYTLRTMFVRQELVEYGGIGKPRIERYHWLTRADVIGTTYGANLGDIRQPLVIYYDVYLLNEFYPNQFYGAGAACDRQPTSESIVPCGGVDPNTGVLTDPFDCLGTLIFNPDGSISLGDDLDIRPIGDCKPGFGSRTLQVKDCPLSDGRTLRVFQFLSTRPQRGCASLNSGKTKIGPDPKGYSFILTVRTVSIGSSYN
jgi:hypothetical protein